MKCKQITEKKCWSDSLVLQSRCKNSNDTCMKYQFGEKPKLWQKHKQHQASFSTVLFLLAINTCQQPFTLLS